jgi:DNA-directed RNA polymerase specialized sigma24 family protein
MRCVLEMDVNPADEWIRFILDNCSAMFRIALLLTADPLAGETALVESLEGLDLTTSPSIYSIEAWQKSTVTRCLRLPEKRLGPTSGLAESMLQPGLRLIARIDRLPRVCFVLRLLLGYTPRECAQLLHLGESELRVLLRMAVTQLCNERNRKPLTTA